ncbi:LpqN/LpqT family lipoprotein [Mycobacterium colombiense]|uniref:LpqN/LpqT family lipoprotein n=1 Tax=Mycobacterium colombiense TaxID=339268 RepID=UPI003B75CFDE
MTGDVDPAKLIQHAPGEVQNLTRYQGGGVRAAAQRRRVGGRRQHHHHRLSF